MMQKEALIPLLCLGSLLVLFIAWLTVELKHGPEAARVTLGLVIMGMLLFARLWTASSETKLFWQRVRTAMLCKIFRNSSIAATTRESKRPWKRTIRKNSPMVMRQFNNCCVLNSND